MMDFMTSIGAHWLDDGRCHFKVWSPEKERMNLHLIHPVDRVIPMTKNNQGYFEVIINPVADPIRYYFQPDGEGSLPDPASHFQPEGVHGPSEVVDHRQFKWTDKHWKGIPFRQLILYEVHVGVFTKEGTFEAIIPFLDDLLELGINGIELMPVSQFPGNRNWGYDGVFPYAVQYSYGGPQGLKRLVDACHAKGIAVFLDVVYNHIGPEGNYFQPYAPYFTDRYQTPWGEAINFDGEWADGVRDYFFGNVLYWMAYYHLELQENPGLARQGAGASGKKCLDFGRHCCTCSLACACIGSKPGVLIDRRAPGYITDADRITLIPPFRML